MVSKKEFFRDRTVAQIKKMNLKQVYTQKGLVEKILNLDPYYEAIEMRVKLIPRGFRRNNVKEDSASRLNYKYGQYIELSQPLTEREAHRCEDIPLDIRRRDLGQLEGMDERNIHAIGYSSVPVLGDNPYKDFRKRLYPFVWLLEGQRVYAYAETMVGGVEIENLTDIIESIHHKNVQKEGALVIANIPSRSEKERRYKFVLDNVPISGSVERRSIIWSLEPTLKTIDEDEVKGRTEHDIQNRRLKKGEKDVITFYQNHIAAYLGVIEQIWKKTGRMTPFEMSPFAVATQLEVDYYMKLRNNVLIYDPTLSKKTEKDQLRHLHIDEICMMISKSIGVLGHDETFFYDFERDGSLKNYDWTLKAT